MARGKTKTPQKKAEPKAKRPRKGGWFSWRLLFHAGALCVIWGFILTIAVLAWCSLDLPDIRKGTVFERRPSVIVLARDGQEIGRFGDVTSKPVTLKDLPPTLIQAVIATEDRRFYQHIGIDPVGMLRALMRDIAAGHVVEGGSTITQQLAKNLFLTSDRTFKRKIQEVMLAIWLERLYTKDQILAAYLNRVYLGAGTYGVGAAAQTYFGKNVRDLDLHESAIIAGLLKAPTQFSPKSNPNEANARAAIVLDNMVDAGYLTPAARAAIGETPPVPRRKPGEAVNGQYFADWILDESANLLGGIDQDIVVRTTLDPNLERAAEHAVTGRIESEGGKEDASQAALLSLDQDGAILAMVGGVDWHDSQFNHATQAKRQPGSSFKPFIYLAAIMDGMTPDTMVDDHPIKIGSWEPANFDGKFRGPMALKDALANSINSIAIQLLQKETPERAIRLAADFGITSPLTPNLSLALGTSEVTLYELTGAYATINSEGRAVQPYDITEIDTPDKKALYRHRALAAPQVADQAAVHTLKDMMRGVVENGTGRAAAIPGHDISAKTGTSGDYRDAWFMGMSGNLTTGVWVGNDDDSSMKRVTGGGLPARIWRDYMLVALDTHPVPLPDLSGGVTSGSGASSGSASGADGLTSFIQLVTGSKPADVQYHYPDAPKN